jgi:hypothetical protein
MADGDDNTRDRRTPRPPNPEDLERIRSQRLEPEPLEPTVGAPPRDRGDAQDPPGGEPSEPSG